MPTLAQKRARNVPVFAYATPEIGATAANRSRAPLSTYRRMSIALPYAQKHRDDGALLTASMTMNAPLLHPMADTDQRTSTLAG